MFRRISSKELVEFNRVFSLLLISWIPILDSLEIITRQIKNEKFKDILKKVAKDIKSGSSLSKSFAKYPEVFSEVYIANLRVAEETGNIAEVLTQYTDYQEKFLNLKRKIIQAARYPLFVMVLSFAVMFFMLFFLIPTFEGLFTSVKTNIPPITQFLLSTSSFFIDNGYTLFFASLVMIFLSAAALKSEYMKQNFIDKLILRLPYFSNLFIQNLLARFSLSMSILLKSRVTLLEALKISKNISTNTVFRDEITNHTKRLIKGESLTANVKNSRFFDVTFRRMLAAGEESAELDKVFQIISEYYSKEFDYRLENINSMIEPLLILFVGLLVAVILIAMYLPIFEIINYIGV
ncbi:type II secretion system F family protein [Bacteroidota bacterium]